ncbi:thioredoxin domain-containing protein [Bifidobacterium sp. ESL0784]|uniref:DsbA family protein n=1 Tax=Bifidobacterium sp. ESL0784 TaxID=2983231 RepID=UPI0023F8166C|nr:thioredoxin domain-containing protein [Bifidobacterium sp. ESL0784]MDF7640083.1 thioredoxin domain-containing protein [Bifidobacterium sp. ESL0784]
MARHTRNDYEQAATATSWYGGVDAGDLLIQTRRAQEAKERKQRRIIGSIAFFIVVIFVAVIGLVSYRSIAKRNAAQNITEEQAYVALQNVKVKPKFTNDKGGILFSKAGYGMKQNDAPTVEIYTDPMCPGCAVLHQQMDATFRALLDAGQVNFEIHPVTFLDNMSTDHYSSRADNGVAYIASNDPNPDHLLDFLTNIHADSFQPGEASNYKSVSNEQLRQQAMASGVPADIAAKAFGGEYNPWLSAAAQYTLRRPELKDVAGQFKGKLTTPVVVINGKMLDISGISDIGLTYKVAILQSIGLSNEDVGRVGKQPAIGSNGNPTFPKTQPSA